MEETMINAAIDPVKTGENIREAMNHKNLTVRDITLALGLSTPNSVYKWLRGDTVPSIDNIYALSLLLDSSLDDLIAGRVVL